MSSEATPRRKDAVRALYRARPRSRFLKVASGVFLGLAAHAWLGGTVEAGELFTERRADNLWRFLSRDAMPKEAREAASSASGVFASAWATLSSLGEWALRESKGRNMQAAAATLALAVLASVLAAILGLLLAPWTARTASAAREPFRSAGAPRRPHRPGGTQRDAAAPLDPRPRG